MSENKEITSKNKKVISKKGIILMGIAALGIFLVGITLWLLDYNEAFYSDDPTLRAIFGAITFTGDPIFLVLLVALFYIGYDKRYAKNLAVSLLFSVYINGLVKEIAQDPRPGTNVKNGELMESGYGFPSGHSQNAIATWGYIGHHFKDKSKPFVIPIILSAFIFLIAVSRLILGMHDLDDIIGGLLIGIGYILVFIHLEPKISPKLAQLSLGIKLFLAIVIPIGLFLLGTLFFPTAGVAPETYDLIGERIPSEFADAGGFAQAGGALLGILTAYILEKEYVDYQPSELNIKWKAINLIIGLAILFTLYLGLEMVLRGNVIFRFARYAIVSFILVLLVPMLLKKINHK
ncbi:MAG: phosphatase PAP2 family protein [Promethearchaeia archaeon]